MLDHVGLVRLDGQAGAHRLLRLGQFAELFQQAGTLIEQRDAGVVLLQRVGPPG